MPIYQVNGTGRDGHDTRLFIDANNHAAAIEIAKVRDGLRGTPTAVEQKK